MIQCPLCQHPFDPQSACHGCGFTNGCTLIRCPNCGYEFVEESKTIGWIRKWIDRLKKRIKKENNS